jgi:pyrimidine-nucleoside phosphorylase
MKTAEDAEKLAKAMVNVGIAAGRKCSAVLTDMSKPLGHAVGNSLEVIEAIEALKGNAPKDLYEVSLTLAAKMLSVAGKGDFEECYSMAENALHSGKALSKLCEMIELQGGDPKVTEDYSLFTQPKYKKEIFAPKDGYVKGISCEKTGLISLSLGAGRKTKDGDIDSTAGIYFNCTVGDKVSKGKKLATLYTSSECDMDEAAKELENVFTYSETAVNCQKNIIKVI